jgi:hypothetical protein
MRRQFVLLILTLFLLSMSGCFVRTQGHGRGHRHGSVRGARCHPSQHWDGRKCRHKGKGHGARKHDR